jgi:hypothetical protein
MHGCIVAAIALLAVPSSGPTASEEDPRAEQVAVVQEIAPGVIVSDHLPRPWSHLVIRSVPRLTSGDLDSLPRSAFHTATLIRTVILADVGRSVDDPSVFALRRIGVALCLPDSSRGDVVVSSGRLQEAGMRLGLVEKVVLRSAESEVKKGGLIATGSAFALYRGPVILQVGQEHRRVELSYAFIVDPQTGSLRVLVWSEDPGQRSPGVPDRLVELNPNLSYECRLNVKAERVLGAVPVSWSFAMEDLPPGTLMPVSPRLAQLLRAEPAARDYQALEQELRTILTASRSQARDAPAVP